jgi:hypothetical protein
VVGRRQRPGSSRPPLRIGVLDLLLGIDTTVAGWLSER